MSLLLFSHDVDSVLIVTDTLATAPDGEPFMFQSKAWSLPHLNMVVAVTGVANLGAAWNDLLRTSAIAQDVEDIDSFAQRELSKLWSEIPTEGNHTARLTATIYHFGFVPSTDTPVRYTYRSRNDFRPERSLGPGFAAKPAPENFPLVPPGSLDDFVSLAQAIRTEQDAKPLAERIIIGGELFMTFQQDWATQTLRIHRFDDYEAVAAQMRIRVERENRLLEVLAGSDEL